MAQSNANCLLYGGVYCRLNFESQPSYNITVAVTDSGLPPRSSEFVLVIHLTDVNDQPRDLSLVTNLVSVTLGKSNRITVRVTLVYSILLIRFPNFSTLICNISIQVIPS